jgi:hypothetical protein
MKIEDYEKLPDRISTETLALMFQEVLNNFKQGIIEKKNFLIILSQLMDRQVMSYELLDDSIRNGLDIVLCDLWDTDSYEGVDIILSIVVNLGLKNCYEKIKNSVNQNKKIDKLILEEILEAIEDVGENILNPYHDLEQFK